MDLANYNLASLAQAGSDVTLNDIYTGEPTDAIFTVLGANSPNYRNAKMAASIDNPAPENATTMDKVEILTKWRALVVSSCVTDWVGLTDGGVEVEFSRERCHEICLAAPDIADQLLTHIQADENFS
jgi:hypothetical protein